MYEEENEENREILEKKYHLLRCPVITPSLVNTANNFTHCYVTVNVLIEVLY